jgi:hypothetical protein
MFDKMYSKLLPDNEYNIIVLCADTKKKKKKRPLVREFVFVSVRISGPVLKTTINNWPFIAQSET